MDIAKRNEDTFNKTIDQCLEPKAKPERNKNVICVSKGYIPEKRCGINNWFKTFTAC